MSGDQPKPFLPSRVVQPAPAQRPTDSATAQQGQDRGAPPNAPPPPAGGNADVPPQNDGTPTQNDISRLGSDLARSMQDDGYHPVILFGTNYSGKTSVLLSLFSTLMTEPRLNTGLVLCDPILGTATNVSRELHREAVHTFEVKTQAFIEGDKIPKTNVPLPFFIPVEMRPLEKQSVRLAFLESNGEWYRPLRNRGASLSSTDRLYPGLRGEIEDFIASFQGAITFLYLIPYTQSEVYSEKDNKVDNEEVQSASLAIAGVLRAYDKIRANHRGSDRHLMLVTKWDAHTAREADRADGLVEDRRDVLDFANRRYAQAVSAFKGLNATRDQMQMNAYCAGMINERGLLQLKHDDDVRHVIAGYPIRLWTYLYQNALLAAGMPVQPPFPQPPEPNALVKWFRKLLAVVSGER